MHQEEETHYLQFNKMSIENKIRKKLLETKEKKEKLLIEREIVKSRILMIFENDRSLKKFRRLPEDRKIRVSFQILQELAYHDNNGILTEDLGGIIQSIFGTSIGGGFGQAILEPAINWLLSGIGMQDSMLKKFVISFLSKKEGFWNLFKDCETLTKGIVESIAEAVVMNVSQTKEWATGFWMVALRNILGDFISGTDFANRLEEKLSGPICSLFGKATTNAKDVLTKIKDAKPVEPTKETEPKLQPQPIPSTVPVIPS